MVFDFLRSPKDEEEEVKKPKPDIKAEPGEPSIAGSFKFANPDLFKDFDLFVNPEAMLTQENIENYIPEQGVIPHDDKTFKALTAADITEMRRNKLLPHIYANPMQHLDYRIYESLLKHTFIGALADSLVRFLIGTGFKPELVHINPNKDPEKNKKEIEANQDIITTLMQIDNEVEKNSVGDIDASFKQKISAAIMSCLMYNRGALMFIYEKPVVIAGKEYGEIPSHLVFAHAQDLGMIDTDQKTRRLKRVQWRNTIDDFTKMKDMLYLWNPLTSSKVHNSWFYGMSILSPMISASKLIRTLLSETFPAISRNAWAGVFFLIVKNDGNTTQSKRAEYEAIAKGAPPGKPNILIKDPDDTKVENIDYDAKVVELKDLLESMIKLCISIIGLPQVGFYDESAANRATMVGKIQLTMRTTIDPIREWIGDSISSQWYQRWFELIYKDKPELLEKFKIKLSWTDLHIAEWYDSIEAALTLDGRRAIKDNEFGELIGLDNYDTIVDPDAETNAGGDSKGMTMNDSETGDKLQIKHKKNKE